MHDHIKHLKTAEHVISYQSYGFVLMAVFSVLFGITLSAIGSMFFSSISKIKDLTLLGPVFALILTGYIIHNAIKYNAQRGKK